MLLDKRAKKQFLKNRHSICKNVVFFVFWTHRTHNFNNRRSQLLCNLCVSQILINGIRAIRFVNCPCIQIIQNYKLNYYPTRRGVQLKYVLFHSPLDLFQYILIIGTEAKNLIFPPNFLA